MRKRNFGIIGQSVITKLLEKKKRKIIYKRYYESFFNQLNLDEKGKHQVSYNFHIKFPPNLFLDKIQEIVVINILELTETLYWVFPNNNVSIRIFYLSIIMINLGEAIQESVTLLHKFMAMKRKVSRYLDIKSTITESIKNILEIWFDIMFSKMSERHFELD